MLTLASGLSHKRGKTAVAEILKPFKEVENCFSPLVFPPFKSWGEGSRTPHEKLPELFPTMKWCLCSSLHHFISRARGCSTSFRGQCPESASESALRCEFDSVLTAPPLIGYIQFTDVETEAVGGSLSLPCLGIWSVAELAARSVDPKALAFLHHICLH